MLWFFRFGQVIHGFGYDSISGVWWTKIVTRTFSKIAKLRSIIDERNLSVDIEVDGGVNLQNVEEIKQAGANVFVAGTKIFKGNVEENIKNFKEILK